MPTEDMGDVRAQKLAAARKKLREYQKRSTPEAISSSQPSSIAGGSSVSSNISEASDIESPTNGQEVVAQVELTTVNATLDELLNAPSSITTTGNTIPTAAGFFQAPTQSVNELYGHTPRVENTSSVSLAVSQPNVQAIEVLIAEKSALTTELNKYRCICRERDLEIEELQTQLGSATKRRDELQQSFLTLQQSMEQVRNSNAELQHKLALALSREEDQTSHLEEVKKLLAAMQERATALEHSYKEKCNEVEMAQIRIRQLSDETNVNQDDRVENLTQTKFMYEQQIRDLQAMVQQLTQDKGQANTQYQSYVQHLNTEIASINERNSELMDECAKYQERERQLVEHISGLEKEIQKNLSRQNQLKEKATDAEGHTHEQPQEHDKEIKNLHKKINDFDNERHEFLLKIKSQEDRLEHLQKELQLKQEKLEELTDTMKDLAADQPDKSKLLATMESDKLAASRALAQNIELKKQLDELERRFVQLTNDKADLINKLQAEEHVNREMSSKYAGIEERLQKSEDRFKFKDEEMIRLSHENVELTLKASTLEKQLLQRVNQEVKRETDKQKDDCEHDHKNGRCDDNESRNHERGDSIDNDTSFLLPTKQNLEDNTENHNNKYQDADNGHDYNSTFADGNATHTSADYTVQLASTEAVEKLQERFTKLMTQVADLTEEKQRLEHLVLQLQGETETIGEYITLYQTQRRMLKQREYEKAAQMQMLQTERELMREKIAVLNNLVSSLSAELPRDMRIHDHINSSSEEDASASIVSSSEPIVENLQHEVESNEMHNSAESQEILAKIQYTITEIKQNMQQQSADVSLAQTVDNLNCCLGKFEVV